MKIIAFYLPQFHTIPENDEWWGEGFTEWVNVKKARPLFEDHYQPRIPLDDNYYNLLSDEVKQWQVKLARKYGIYGFCFYHYWFNGKKLLEKPIEQYLNNSTLDHPFCICWANEHWTKAWASKNDQILIAQSYGGPDEWEEHFQYLLPFIQDPRYICIEGKPLFVLYRPDLISCLNEMLDFWNKRAVESGLPGICFAYQQIHLDLVKNKDDSRFSYNIEYQPNYAVHDLTARKMRMLKWFKRRLTSIAGKFGINLEQTRPGGLIIRNYDEIWRAVLSRRPTNEKSVPGAFVDWDNTPRRGEKGSVFAGSTPEKFKSYLKQQLIRAKKEYNKDMLFVFAWNEWAEGGYLEPDEKYKYEYLEAVRDALLETDEFPEWIKE